MEAPTASRQDAARCARSDAAVARASSACMTAARTVSSAPRAPRITCSAAPNVGAQRDDLLVQFAHAARAGPRSRARPRRAAARSRAMDARSSSRRTSVRCDVGSPPLDALVEFARGLLEAGDFRFERRRAARSSVAWSVRASVTSRIRASAASRAACRRDVTSPCRDSASRCCVSCCAIAASDSSRRASAACSSSSRPLPIGGDDLQPPRRARASVVGGPAHLGLETDDGLLVVVLRR